MFALKRWLCCVAFVTSSFAFAQEPRPSVMPFPLEFKRTPSGFSNEDKEAMQRDYTRLLRLAGAAVPDFARYDLALKELKRSDCEREDECLVQLAKKAEALYAVYASLDYTLEGAVLVSGRVVREDGKVASPTATVKLAKGRDAFKDIAKNALTQLFAQLKIGELPATRQVEVVKIDPVKDPIKDPPPPPPPLVIEDTGAGQRAAGKGLVYAGAGVAVLGGVLAAVGCGFGCGVTPTMGGSLPEPQLEAARTGRALTGVGLAGLGIGAVAAGIGAVLWGTAAAAPVNTVTILPISGGGVVQFGGRF
ncbi:MAG: hypothetical protein Q8L48_15695 [Archangium sp.]|nr:hypothetical protein [Archangium sp.]